MAVDAQSMCQFWKAFDLHRLQEELDTTANELALRQDESDNSRKKLVEQSRDFKKNTPEDVRRAVAPLLKSFQTEVDSLSKRSKAAEADFLKVYKRLVDLPDPVSALEQALLHQKTAQKVSDLEIENRQLRETLQDYSSEFAEVKNQEVTIKQLREKIRDYEQRIEADASSKAREKERELEKQFAEKRRQFDEAQLVTAKKLGEAENRASSLQTALDSSQSELFEAKAKFDDVLSAKSAEMDMLLADLERANEKIILLDKELEQAKLQLKSVVEVSHRQQQQQSGNDARTRDVDTALEELRMSQAEVELAAKDSHIAQLVEECQKMQAAMAKQKLESVARMTKLEEELAARERAVADLREQLGRQGDYEEVKKELSILKSVEFSSVSADASNSKPLEVLLLEKNRGLQAELVQVKNAHGNLTGRYDSVLQDYQEAIKTLQEQRALIAQLEEDLRSVNALSLMFRGEGEGEASHMSTELIAEAVRSKTATADALMVDSSRSATVAPAAAMSANATAANSLLPIVHSQRERYRLRVQELEGQNTALQQHLQLQQNEMDKLRSDNLKLYEKIKFLQSYPSSGTQRAAGGNGGPPDDTESRYSSQYEMRLDPFASFSSKERQRKYASLKPHEKITLGLGRIVMGNAMARSAFFFYMILLHLLVFMSLYKVVHMDEACQDSATSACSEKFSEHMIAFHAREDSHLKT